MNKEYRTHSGSLLVEAVLGIALLAMFFSGIIVALFVGQESTVGSGEHTRAVLLAEQGLEAARAIRDQSFGGLTTGMHGIRIGTDGAWEWSGTGTTSMDGFTQSIVIEPLSDERRGVTSRVTWAGNHDRRRSIELRSELTDWGHVWEVGDWSSPHLLWSVIDESAPLWNALALADDVLFVGSGDPAGPGLSLYNTADPENPVRIQSSFVLGAATIDLAKGQHVLSVLTDDHAGELRIYTIDDPYSFSEVSLIDSIDLPGDARGASIALRGSLLLVGMEESATEAELLVYDISDPSDAVLTGSLDDEGSYADISVNGAFAYVASSADASELRVIDLRDPAQITFAPGEGYNLTDTPDALAVAAIPGKALAGRRSGDVTEEVVLFDTSDSPVPSPPPGPWYHEAGSTVRDISVDPSGTYAFILDDYGTRELRILDLPRLASTGSPEVAHADLSAGGAPARMLYDPQRDLLFIALTKGLFIYAP